ncbi:hypothetical protein RPMA_02350 [Tardiphaga alba]|uniref:Uncharacterized protein n=1 Tax=Tardiphaga alba TaxID=340268 RepID=A0ABX8A3E0_9BRAD|nr:hypothetical protein [Tardiphaga alba]QUS37832.1 hypothetical protein RPMA_02350 [Tardiphaga alba]
MIQPPNRAPGSHLVTTPKSTLSIPVTTALEYDAVIQAALDPAVAELSYIRTVHLGGRLHPLDCVLVSRDGALFALDIADGSSVRPLDAEGLRLLAFDALGASPLRLTRNEIEEEPRCSNARLVWENARHRVRMPARQSVLDALDISGAIPLREFDVRREDVFALACENVIDIDLDANDIDAAEVRRSTVPAAPRPRLF